MDIGYDEMLEKLSKEDLRYRPWTAEDENKVARYYGRVPTEALARALNRTESSVNKKANYLGLRFLRVPGDEEKALLHRRKW